MSNQYSNPSLAKCPACQTSVSRQAASCPRCGQPLSAASYRQTQPHLGNSFNALQMVHNGYGMAHQPVFVTASKSRGVYIVLGLFLGCLGIHNFYAGYNGKAVAQLLITLFLGWLVIGIFITAIWALIDIISVKTDASGAPMS